MVVDSLATLMRDSSSLQAVEPHIYSVFPPGKRTYSYDSKAAIYDLVIGNRLYNRFMWGYGIEAFASFCHAALTSATDGWVLDAACGSLVFTAGVYAQYAERPVVLLDQSLQMLKAARTRLVKLTGSVPPNVVFLQGDIRELPFLPQRFQTIIALNVLHVLQDAEQMMRELESVLMPRGTISLTTLVTGRPRGDRYLRFLHRAGGVALPRGASQVLAAVEAGNLRVTGHEARGNMLLVQCFKN
jgi:SAM-dependent methyltransferase